MTQSRRVRGSKVYLKEISEVAAAIVDRRMPVSEPARPTVESLEQLDMRSAMVTICGLLGVETPTTVSSVALLGRADWARRSIKGVLPTLWILEDLWLHDFVRHQIWPRLTQQH
jgi:hypothetical protein